MVSETTHLIILYKKKKEYIIEKELWTVPRPENHVFREMRLLYCVRQSEIQHRSLRLASGQKQRREGEWCLSERRETWELTSSELRESGLRVLQRRICYWNIDGVCEMADLSGTGRV